MSFDQAHIYNYEKGQAGLVDLHQHHFHRKSLCPNKGVLTQIRTLRHLCMYIGEAGLLGCADVGVKGDMLPYMPREADDTLRFPSWNV